MRVNGSLLWSAIDSFGSSQFMRLIVALGASEIQEIDYTRTAFGQLAFSDLDRKSIYIFEGLNEPPKFNSSVDGFAGVTRYPSLLKPGDNKPAFLCLNTDLKSNDESLARNTRLGYSQAYTPSSFTSLGVYDSIPINVNVLSRNKKGKTEKHNIGVELKAGKENNNLWRNAGEASVFFDEGNSIVLYFDDTTAKKDDDVPRKTAETMRRQMLEALDFGSTYMLGAAKFRLDSYVGENRILTDSDSVEAKFVCIEGGEVPSTPYSEKTPLNVSVKELEAIEDKFQEALDILEGDEEERRNVVLETHTDAEGNEIDLNVNINFSGELEVRWTPVYKSLVNLEFDPLNGKRTEENKIESPLTERVVYFAKGGSIDFTQDLREQVGAEDSTIDLTVTTKEIRKSAKQQKKALKRLIDDINAGVFDGADDDIPNTSFSYTESIDSYSERRGDKDGLPAAVPFKDFQFSDGFENQTCMGVPTGEIDNLERNANNSVSTKEFFRGVEDKSDPPRQEGVSHHYTFAYKDSRGVLNLFNFTGLQNTESTDVFLEDEKLGNRRNNLLETQKRKQDEDINTNTDINTGSVDGDGIRTLISADALANQSADNRTNANRKLLSTGADLKKPTFDENISGSQKAENKQIDRINKRIETLLGRRRADAIAIIEADIALLDDFLEDVPDDLQIKDRVGTKQIRADLRTLITEKKTARDTIDGMLENWPDSFLNGLDNNFFTKCLVKAELATYSTVSPCNAVTFSFKSKLFRRISGRQKEYGGRKVDGYSESDNGIKSRMAFFKMAYRQAGKDSWNDIPHMFALRHGSEADFYTQIIFYSESQTEWEFKFDPVFDVNAEINTRSFTNYFFLENSDKSTTVSLDGTSNSINFVGRKVGLRNGYPDEAERGPYLTNEWDMFSVNSDTQVAFSFESGPEIALAAVTEQQLDPSYANKYKRMQTISLGVFAGRNIQDLRSVSTMVLKGKLCRTVGAPGVAEASSSYAPDIFVDTLLDKINGVGKYVTRKNIDFDSLKTAKAFCVKNKLFMDGVIADPGSWREFWVNAASFSLLELARKNGKDTLVPALPVNGSGEFSNSDGLPINVNVSALFTTGNILQDSYKEEFLNVTDSTENLIASIVYRDSSSVKNFTANKSVNVELSTKTASDENSRETFDLSQFVTRRKQAIMFGKFLCNQRRHIRKGIEFRTLPSEAGLEPGDFIYVDVGLKNWDHYSSGMVMAGGALNSPLAPANEKGVQDGGSDTFEFLLYQPSTGTVASESKVAVTTSDDGRSTATFTGEQQYEGWMFVMGEDKPNKRVFRVTELAIEEEGELSVKAIEYPCFEENDAAGVAGTRAHIADFRSSKFKVS